MPKLTKARQRTELVTGIGELGLVIRDCGEALRRINVGSKHITPEHVDDLDFFATDLRSMSSDLAVITSAARAAIRAHRLKAKALPLRAPRKRGR